MITLHHLIVGRSVFTAWLLEEVGVDYQLKIYHRHPETGRAGDDLKEIHPLGKSPVIEDEGLILAESGAITAYILEKFDSDHRFGPPRSDLATWAVFNQWLHYPEGSVFLPLMMKLLLISSKEPNAYIEAFQAKDTELHLAYIANQLGENEFILGDQFSAADIAVTYMLSFAKRLRLLKEYPTLNAYIKRNMARPAYQTAKEKTGG